jgi:predicted ATPase/DNA-binding CsgD family transcriptional regulator
MADQHASRPNNLPIQLTSFVGRMREIAEVARLLSATRLLTLTGAGGSGKTRLALEVAAQALEAFPDGVWVAELASLSDPALVVQAVTTAVGLRDESGRPLVSTLVDYLRPRRVLLVLDNCEHLIDACAHLTEALLRSCPDMRILATSRQALGIPGETAWRVPSLSLPDPVRLPSTDRLTTYEAVRLFSARATAAAPGFVLTDSNAPAVVRLCHRLDGMPLAIELAAARVRALTPEQIASRLDDRFRLLTGGGRTVLPRHQTLRATMDWSYDLLSERERTLLRRLSVFAGGCTLEAVEAVCAGGDVTPTDVLDLLTQLSDRSLVTVEMREGEARYRLLETVREYGRMQLREAGEAEETQRHHCQWYVALVERAEPELRGPNQIAWLDRLEENRDNLRAAFEWSRTDMSGIAVGLRLAAALRDFWDIRGPIAEGRAWLDDMLSLYEGAIPAMRVKALNCAGHLAHRQGDYQKVSELCGEALALAEVERDKKGTAEALHHLAHAAEGAGDNYRAAELLESCVGLQRAVGNTLGLATSLNCLANSARLRGDYRRAAALFEEALALFHSLGDKRGRATVVHNLGYVVLRQGDSHRSRALFLEGMTLTKELGDRRVINCLAGLAGASAQVRPEWATTLLGAATALMSAIGVRLEPVNRPDFDHNIALAKDRLGERAFSAAWAQGAAMTLEQAIAYALASEYATARVDAKINRLTPREREVASLIAQGLTNRAIASRLVIAERTVDAHVEHILNKLGCSSRTHVAVWAVEQGLRQPASG